MFWIYIAILTAFIYAISSFVDNYIVDVFFKNKAPQALKIFNGYSYIAIALIMLVFFGFEPMPIKNIILIFAAGIISSLSSIPYYLGLKSEEATGASIFYQLIPIVYFLVDWLIYRENATTNQIIGFIIIFLAPAIIIFSRHHSRARKMEIKAATLFLIYVFLTAISSIITTHAGIDPNGINYAFPTIFICFLLGRGASDVVLSLTHKKWRQHFKLIHKKYGKRFIITIALNQLACIVADLLIRYAYIAGIAAIASVIENSAELIMVFILGIILSIIWPNFGREKLNRHIVLAHLIATILAVIGIIVIQ